MKAVILAGGLGTRISEETSLKPKPMIEIGGKPILWHIMKIYASHGVKDFIICSGYRGYVIKEYFINYYFHQSDVTFDLKNNSYKIHNNNSEDWKVTIVHTGETDMTGSRIRKIREYVKDEDFFLLTYGDGVSDVDITKLIEFHKSHGKLATVTAVKTAPRFGVLDVQNDQVKTFKEKPSEHADLINGGFFALSPKVIDCIEEKEDAVWETKPLQSLASNGELMSFYHQGFWQPMDTLRDKNFLEEIWNSGNAPWKKWKK